MVVVYLERERLKHGGKTTAEVKRTHIANVGAVSEAQPAAVSSQVATKLAETKPGPRDDEHADTKLDPLVKEIFDFIERLYDRQREFQAMSRENRHDILTEWALLLGITLPKVRVHQPEKV